MDKDSPTLPVFGIKRHRMTTDGTGVSTLVGAYGCPLKCRYCLNPLAWNPETLKKCIPMSPETLYEKVKIDALYFLATGGGITFGFYPAVPKSLRSRLDSHSRNLFKCPLCQT